MNSDIRFAVEHYGYPNPLKCEYCKRIIYDDDYEKDGYGGFICSDCKKKYEEEEDDIQGDD